VRTAHPAAAIAAALLGSLPLGAAWAQAASCESLAGKTLGTASIAAATAESPPFSVRDEVPPNTVSPSVPFCRVRGVIKPSLDSDIRFELWLPHPSAWNGKYEGVGNGGFAGFITYAPMGRALDAGYAVSGTDTGHVAQVTDARWALSHPEKVVDFGWRAIHETALASKAVVQAYYGRAPAHAYFAGCSDGGREALMEAQRFPEDYDGIVAGAPANDWTRLLAAGTWAEQALLAAPGGALSAKKLPAITDAVLRACHGEDGMVDDPSQCRFDPSLLLCKGTESNSCLTAAQVTTLEKIYSGPRDAEGASVFPGLTPGGEADPTGWGLWITGTGSNPGEGSLILAFSRGFFANVVFGDPDWDVRSLNFGEDLKITDAKAAAALNARDTDLTRFKAAGGKLIQYHGWYDAAISPMASVRYYEAVAQRLGGLPQTQSFYRLFMGPGMQHCGDGVGPNAVSGPFGLPAPAHDPTHDVVAALAHWVEDGVAPAALVATKYQDNKPQKGVAMQRPWCPWPAVARYSGQGSRNEAANFSCVTAEQHDQ
jgi:tannase/feruloyl esterase